MICFDSLSEIKNIGKTAVALGNFDGVHLGHQTLFKEVLNISKKEKLIPAVFTFKNHPGQISSDNKEKNIFKFINTDEEKKKLIEDYNIKICFDIPFEKNIMNLTPEIFVKDILKNKLNAHYAIVGFNYKFGKHAKGDANLLKKLCDENHMGCIVCDEVRIKNQVVSSSRIRKFIENGDMEQANEFLTRPYILNGSIIKGNRLGNKLGFPTINFKPENDKILPPNGVYFSKVVIDGIEYDGISNLGIRPTIAGKEILAETNILQDIGELYGKSVSLKILKFKRKEIKFKDTFDLRRQIAKDRHDAEEYFDRQI